jgi:hypothetical protein
LFDASKDNGLENKAEKARWKEKPGSLGFTLLRLCLVFVASLFGICWVFPNEGGNKYQTNT